MILINLPRGKTMFWFIFYFLHVDSLDSTESSIAELTERATITLSLSRKKILALTKKVLFIKN